MTRIRLLSGCLLSAPLLALLLSMPLANAAGQTVRAGLYNNPPLSFIDPQGQPAGFIVDLLRLIAGQQQWQLQFVKCNFTDCLQLLRQGEIDLLSPIAFSETRALDFDFSSQALFLNWGRIYTRIGNDLVNTLDLRRQRIAVLKDDIHYQALQELCTSFDLACEFIELQSYRAVAQLVADGDADAGLLNRMFGDWKGDGFGLIGSAILLNPIDVVVAVPRGAGAGLPVQIDQTVARLKADPGSDYYQLLDRWLGERRSSLPGWLLSGVGALLLLLVLVVVLLRIAVRRRTRQFNEEIDQHRRTEEQLKIFSHAFEQSPVSHVITDTDGKILHVNPAFERISGYSRTELIGNTPRIVKSGRNPQQLYAELWRTISAGRDWRGELCNRNKRGDLYWEEAIITPIRNSEGQICHFLAIKKDITAQREYERKLLRQANYDSLTGLPNRLLALDRLEQTLAVASRQRLSRVVMVIDLDDFKKVNDTLGHDLGDELLQEAAARFQQLIREEDTVARLGGDEFLLILGGEQQSVATERMAEKILAAFSQPFVSNGHEILVTASIGIAQAPLDGDGSQALLKNAEAAMYLAKHAGRNTYRYFTPELNIAAERRLELENRLHHAMERDELSLVFQPLMSAHESRVVGAEALLRWHNPEIGEVAPDEFIPLAEATSLIEKIGLWALEQGLAQALQWQQQMGRPLRLAVNVSPRQLEQPLLVGEVQQLLKKYHFPPNQLELEITERTLLRDDSGVLSQLRQLSELGIRLSVDDFGTGYSALSYLKSFPIDTLKVDRSFVRDMLEDEEDAILVKTIIAMGHGLGLETIAEGVEEAEQLARLQSLGCDLIQGYLYSRPLSAADFTIWLAQHRGA